MRSVWVPRKERAWCLASAARSVCHASRASSFLGRHGRGAWLIALVRCRRCCGRCGAGAGQGGVLGEVLAAVVLVGLDAGEEACDHVSLVRGEDVSESFCCRLRFAPASGSNPDPRSGTLFRRPPYRVRYRWLRTCAGPTRRQRGPCHLQIAPQQAGEVVDGVRGRRQSAHRQAGRCPRRTFWVPSHRSNARRGQAGSAFASCGPASASEGVKERPVARPRRQPVGRGTYRAWLRLSPRVTSAPRRVICPRGSMFSRDLDARTYSVSVIGLIASFPGKSCPCQRIRCAASV